MRQVATLRLELNPPVAVERGRGSCQMDWLASQSDLSIGVGIAIATTALSAVSFAVGATWLQWLGIASLFLLGEGLLLVVMAVRGPGGARSRGWIPMTPGELYAYEEERRLQRERQAEAKHEQPDVEEPGSRHWFRMALAPLILGVIFVVLSSTL